MTCPEISKLNAFRNNGLFKLSRIHKARLGLSRKNCSDLAIGRSLAYSRSDKGHELTELSISS
jgi:hypothetical protein